MKPGQPVQARYGKGMEWYNGKILQRVAESENGVATADAYDVVYEDGDKENGVPRWMIRVREGLAIIVVEGEFIWKSGVIEHDEDGMEYYYSMHEIEGSTEIYLYRVGMEEAGGKDEVSVSPPLAHLSIEDDDVLKILKAGGMTEKQMKKLKTSQDMCEAVADMTVIKSGGGGKMMLAIET